jgi:hypothetical protein
MCQRGHTKWGLKIPSERQLRDGETDGEMRDVKAKRRRERWSVHDPE